MAQMIDGALDDLYLGLPFRRGDGGGAFAQERGVLRIGMAEIIRPSTQRLRIDRKRLRRKFQRFVAIIWQMVDMFDGFAMTISDVIARQCPWPNLQCDIITHSVFKCVEGQHVSRADIRGVIKGSTRLILRDNNDHDHSLKNEG